MMKILIIEDHYACVAKLLNVLAPGYVNGESDNLLITITADPDIASELLKREWDVILMDHDLPRGYAGWILLNNSFGYRKFDNALVIAISAVPENNKRLLSHGAHYAVEKMDHGWAEKVKDIIYNYGDKKRDKRILETE